MRKEACSRVRRATPGWQILLWRGYVTCISTWSGHGSRQEKSPNLKIVTSMSPVLGGCGNAAMFSRLLSRIKLITPRHSLLALLLSFSSRTTKTPPPTLPAQWESGTSCNSFTFRSPPFRLGKKLVSHARRLARLRNLEIGSNNLSHTRPTTGYRNRTGHYV